MKRREFIAGLAGAAAWPVAARAEEPRKLQTIGYFGTGSPSSQSKWTAAFVRRLRELGWIEGRNVAVEYRWAQGRTERYTEIATEFVGLNVDVIVTTVPAVAALKQATSVIPIVFALGSDPVSGGLVTSLARPGGNVTGLSTQATDLASKRVELLREVVPDLARFAVLGNVGIPQVVLEMREVAAAAKTFGLQVVPLEIHRAEDIPTAFESLKFRAQALYICIDPLTNADQATINKLALDARMPTMHDFRGIVESGGLMSYGPNFSDQFRRVAELVDKILRGDNPGDIPIEQADKFELVVNLKAAKSIGLTIPESFLLRADEVIE